MTRARRTRTVLGSILCSLAASCASDRSYDQADEAYWRNEPERVKDAYKDAILDPGKNALLGLDKLLSAAFLEGDWATAHSLAIRASTAVNIFLAGESGEADALSLFGQEKDKPFKGEPHERVMVDFYLGVLRLQAHDAEGALAAFRSAMNKDRGSFLLPVEKGEAAEKSDNARRYLYEDDYALLRFLAARTALALGEAADAERHLERAKAIRPELADFFDEGMRPETNVFVIIESGRAPAKLRSGPKGATLAYAEGPVSEVDEVVFDGEALAHALVEDLYLQATTVGGRGVDELNRVKAERQEILQAAGFTTSIAGYGLLLAGTVNRRHSRELQLAGLAVLLVGLAAVIVSEVAIDPRADVRAWTSLPGRITLAVGRARPGGRARLRVSARGPRGSESQEWTQVLVKEGLNVVPVRLLPGRGGGVWTPPSSDPEPQF